MVVQSLVKRSQAVTAAATAASAYGRSPLARAAAMDRVGLMRAGPRASGAIDLDFDPSHMSDFAPIPVTDTPTLAHGLRDYLQHKGTVRLMDMHTKSQHLTSFLRKIHQPDEINEHAIAPFVPPSQDKTLHEIAVKEKCRYLLSTSSVTASLSHIYFVLSRFRTVDISQFSEEVRNQSPMFMTSYRRPVSIIVRPQNGMWGVDADKRFADDNTILSDLGKSIERMLTMEADEFTRKLLKANSQSNDLSLMPEVYHYRKIKDLMLRSQLDCHDPDLPGDKKSFDLKTRATAPIRFNLSNYEEFMNYRLLHHKGWFRAYEREYYDMVRSVFVKYGFQLRIGNMAGAFVTYHNTDEIFGFEFVALEEMDRYLYGNSYFADKVFHASVNLFKVILDEATSKYPESTLRIGLYANGSTRDLDVFVEAVDDVTLKRQSSTTRAIWVDQPFITTGQERVHKYRLTINTYVNGELSDRPVSVQPGDLMSVQYRLVNLGAAAPLDYFNFRRQTHFYDMNLKLASNVLAAAKYGGKWH
eukprot:GILJ01003045.1.p1 GENE.GILJ01003045.1~~GILJ01003045.1.p1  ORF type:complete len:528 (-),score=70.47 GILJ01003045.1:206-1789(-)